MYSSRRPWIIISIVFFTTFVTTPVLALPPVKFTGAINILLQSNQTPRELVKTMSTTGELGGGLSGSYPVWVYDPETGGYKEVLRFSLANASVTLRGGKVPRIVVNGTGNYSWHAVATGLIEYYFGLKAVVPDAPSNIYVAINIKAKASVSAYTMDDLYDNTSAVAYLSVKGPNDTNFRLVGGLIASAPPDTTRVKEFLIGESLKVGGEFLVRMQLYGDVKGETTTGHEFYGSGSYTGELDPVIEIDPNQLVDYHGNLVPATSLYSLVFSPGLEVIGLADFDGDGATDVAAFHLPSDQFFTDYTGNMGQYGWGGSDSYPLVWDYNGDGKTEASIYHIPTNQWFVRGLAEENLGQFGFGAEDSIPVPGDYDGDGVMESAFYHWPTNRWFVEGQADAIQFGWGGAECIPFAGDYDGDGTTDMMLYHVPTNQWFVYGIGNLGQFGWGGVNCIPVPGDWNGDGKTEVAVYYAPDNEWVWRDGGGIAHFMGKYGWGGTDSFPIPGDYDGDGTTERGFYRYVQNRWFIDGEPDFVWGWGGQDFMPITSQMAVYNWFRFMLGRFQ